MSSKSSSYTRTTIESYDNTVDEYITKVDKLHPAKESAKFLSFLGEKASILDIGCGPGRDARIFSDKGYHVVGIDLSKKMIAAAKKKVKNAQFKVMDALKLKFNDCSFDGIWANAILMHLPKKDVTKVIREIHRILKNNGIFYLSVKEGKGEVLLPDDRYGGVKKFWSFFTKWEIEEAVKNAGLIIVDSYVTGKQHVYATHPWISVFARKS